MPLEGRRPTLADVAAAAGVSTALVSIVMREAPGASAATRRRVLEVADQLGYVPDSRARLLRSGRSRLLGVVYTVQHGFHADVVTGLYAAADQLGYELALSAATPRRSEKRAMESLLADRCEALLVVSTPATRTGPLGVIAERMPVVVLARGARHRRVDVVRGDDVFGMRVAVDHLVGLGHQRITHIDGGAGPASADRRTGYLEAMSDHGLARYAKVVAGGDTEEDGARATPKALRHRPTAITVFNDRAAVGVRELVRDSGRDIPGDVSIVGYDDTRLADLSFIALTTVSQDVPGMTRLAVQRAVDRIEGNPVEQREVVIAPRLVVRGTTAPPAPDRLRS